MKVAIVYDRVNKWGGAERVLLALHELFPDAPLFTSVCNREIAKWASVFDVRTSFLQKFPFAKSSHEIYAILMPLAFEQFSFDEYDLVISVTSEAAKGILTKPKTLHICYCLTPTRYLWSGYEQYFDNQLFKTLSMPAIAYLRTWDKVASKRPDVYIAISKEVQGRIKKYYRRDSEVIYPPVGLQTTDYGLQTAVDRRQWTDSYFLIVSRLVPYKRIDIAIEACNKLVLPLKIIGSGSQEWKLKQIAGPKITFQTNLTDEQLKEYYKGCRALIMPGIEDFGIVMVEAGKFGKPVIAYKGGGALEIVKSGITGEFFHPQTVHALMEVLKTFSDTKYDPANCKRFANKFNKERFGKEFMQFVEKVMRGK